MNKKPILLCLLIIAACFIVNGLTNAEGRYNKTAFEKVMEDANKNARVLLGSLIARDWKKAESTAEALDKNAKTMMELTPKANADRIVEFQAHADSLAASAASLAALAKEQDRAGSTAAFGDLVGVCMDCHADFRK